MSDQTTAPQQSKPHVGACEKCWTDANWLALHLGGSVVDRYQELLRERKDKPCTEAQQRGEDR